MRDLHETGRNHLKQTGEKGGELKGKGEGGGVAGGRGGGPKFSKRKFLSLPLQC